MLETITPDVIAQAQKGNASVIAELYEHYRVSVFRYFYYRVGDIQAAEDLTQEVFVRLLRALGSYQVSNVSFDAWVFQIARNLAIDYYRKSQGRSEVALESVQAVLADTDQAGEHRLNSTLLRQALEQINEAQRDVIVLRFVNGLPINQVAQALHKSEDAVKGLQRRALSALREILTSWEVEDV